MTKPGDLWELGHHRLPCGDDRAADDFVHGRGQAAMAFLDPPYNVRIRDIGSSTPNLLAFGELSRPDFLELLKSTLAAAAEGLPRWRRHIGELFEAAGAVYGDVLNLAVPHIWSAR